MLRISKIIKLIATATPAYPVVYYALITGFFIDFFLFYTFFGERL